eukprot:NODE_11076_length_268_cov_20.301370_g9306_i0.p1 GENE.NODE_11076_length_268_cov_20.301370_g9306_i0~~NODE_11076_length_268_cov_20.301370_g9306_i0.p1  ORF type:complete len:64 (-),score=10.42 NODE_11076_length_268_cov_20.301370_g9306_i0:45-236(-)
MSRIAVMWPMAFSRPLVMALVFVENSATYSDKRDDDDPAKKKEYTPRATFEGGHQTNVTFWFK